MNPALLKLFLLSSGIFSSAMAQIALKTISDQAVFSQKWFFGMIVSLLFYGASFILYSFVLRFIPLSTASPVMTVGVMLLVVMAGLFFGETMTIMKMLGLILGIASIMMIMS